MILNPTIDRYEWRSSGRYFVVGDIHGHFTELEKQLMDIGFNFEEDILFCTGDLVDRGPESERALEFLGKHWFRSVLGNHCEHVIKYETHNKERWYERGGEWHSKLSEDDKTMWQSVFMQLPIAIEVVTPSGVVGIVHADIPTDDWSELEYLLDGRDRANTKIIKNRINNCLYSRHRFNQSGLGMSAGSHYIKNISKVYFGHCTVLNKVMQGNCVWVDTFGLSGEFTIEELK